MPLSLAETQDKLRAELLRRTQKAAHAKSDPNSTTASSEDEMPAATTMRSAELLSSAVKYPHSVDSNAASEHEGADDTSPDASTAPVVNMVSDATQEHSCEIHAEVDVSFEHDGTVIKRVTKEGVGNVMPHDASKVQVLVRAVTANRAWVLQGGAQTLEFVVGDGAECEAIECACLTMKVGDEAMITCTSSQKASHSQLKLNVSHSVPIVFGIVLLEVLPQVHEAKMTDAEKVDAAFKRKEAGTQLFKLGHIHRAMQRYKIAMDLVKSSDSLDEQTKFKAKQIKEVCYLNRAQGFLKLGDPKRAELCCTAVLLDEQSNEKFRRAAARMQLRLPLSAISGLRYIEFQEISPANLESHMLLRQAIQNQKDPQASMCAKISYLAPNGKTIEGWVRAEDVSFFPMRKRLGDKGDEAASEEAAEVAN